MSGRVKKKMQMLRTEREEGGTGTRKLSSSQSYLEKSSVRGQWLGKPCRGVGVHLLLFPE